MPYLPSIVLAAIGLVLLGTLVARTFRALRRFSAVRNVVVGNAVDRAGLIRARSAGVRVALSQKWRAQPAAPRASEPVALGADKMGAPSC